MESPKDSTADEAAAAPRDGAPAPAGAAAPASTSGRFCLGCQHSLAGVLTGPCPRCQRPFDPADAATYSHHSPSNAWLDRFDRFMADHPWHPRVVPFLAYLVLLAVIGLVAAPDRLPAAYPVLYTLQCGFVLWLLWRYRRLLPELTIRFHWLAAPVGIVVFLAWVWIGMIVAEFRTVQHAGLGPFTAQLFNWMIDPATPVTLTRPDGSPFSFVDAKAAEGDMRVTMGHSVGWAALPLRLLGMSLVVPLFEELFIRSLMLRSLSDRRNTALGLVQVMEDMPVVGDWMSSTKLADEAAKQPPIFGREFSRVELGHLTIFGVTASTLVFMVNHTPRDYLGCIFCGVAYCLLLRATRGRGLGPVCWAHGITNALIWWYTVHTGDWRFL